MLTSNGLVPSDWLQEAMLHKDQEPSSSSSSQAQSSSKRTKLSKEDIKAMNSVASAIHETEDDDYLDNTLVEEMGYIKEYQTLLKSIV